MNKICLIVVAHIYGKNKIKFSHIQEHFIKSKINY